MWQVHEWSGSARDFHGRDLPMSTALWYVRKQSPAVVLGSSQKEDVANAVAARQAGFDVFKRRTGGGAVLVDDTALWVDATLPRDHPWWTDDVSASMLWLGDAWSRVLSQLSSTTSFAVHRGAMVRSVASDAVCFAGRAPGEVFATGKNLTDKKIVGMSQRRSREGARFQCVVYTHWSPHWMALVTGYGLSDSDVSTAAHSGCGLDDVAITASPEQIVTTLAHDLNRR